MSMEYDPMDERDLYNKYHNSDNTVSTTISTIVVQGGPLQLVIALLRVSTHFPLRSLWMVSVSMSDISSPFPHAICFQLQTLCCVILGVLIGTARKSIGDNRKLLESFSRPSHNSRLAKRDYSAAACRRLLCWNSLTRRSWNRFSEFRVRKKKSEKEYKISNGDLELWYIKKQNVRKFLVFFLSAKMPFAQQTDGAQLVRWARSEEM